MRNKERAELNELAIEYYNAKKLNNAADEKRLRRELFLKINLALADMIYSSQNNNTTIQAIDKGIEVAIRDYDPGKGKVFTSYLYSQIQYKKKDETKRDDKCVYSDDENDIIGNAPDRADISETIESDYIKYEVDMKLPTLITRFYEHNGKGVRAKNRYSYYRIFYTEHIILLVASAKSTEGFNKTEAYECSDQELVRFVSYSDYTSLDDLVYLKLKKRSEVLPGNSDDKLVMDLMEKKPHFQSDVIIEYRYVSKLDNKRVAEQTILSHKKKYKADFRALFGYLR